MQRFVLVILACFWAFMGFRLWQVEYAGKRLGAAVDIAVNREVRISNQARIQAKVTKVAKNHNRVAVIPVKKAATVVAAVTEIKFILLPEFDFLLG